MRNAFLYSIMLFTAWLTLFAYSANAATVPQGTIPANDSNTYNISEIFGNSIGVNTFYLTFKNSPAANFSLKYNDNISISVVDGFITVAQVDSILKPGKADVLYYAALSNKSAYINLGFELGDDNSVTVQTAESDSAYSYVAASPIMVLLDRKSSELPGSDNLLEISNLSTSSTLSVIRSSFIDLASQPEREKRKNILECLIPALAITNYVLQTPCDLVSRVWSYVAGDRDKAKTNTPVSVPDFAPEFSLSAVSYAQNINPYAAYSASQVCNVSQTTIYSIRKPRSPGDIDCVFNSMDIITAYLILTNYDFDQTHFDRTVANILSHGSSGIPDAHPDLEHALVSAVQQQSQIADNSIARATSQLMAEAAALNASTTSLYELLSDPQGGNEPSTSGHQESTEANPDDLAIGFYVLDLQGVSSADFSRRHPDTRPRAWNGSSFVATNTDFTVEIIANDSQDNASRILNIINQWYTPPGVEGNASGGSAHSSSYRPLAIGGAGNAAASELLQEGRDLADAMRVGLNTRHPDSLYFVVSYNGRPAAVVQAHIDSANADVELSISLSNPENIAIPYSSQALRGAGQRALQELIKYCAAHGIKQIHSISVTAPSVHLKKKYGFKFDDIT